MTSRPLPVKITTDGLGVGAVHVDGHDISGLVSSVRIDAAADGISEVTVDLVAAFGLEVDLGRAVVEIDAGTRDFLIRLGWTPPGEPA